MNINARIVKIYVHLNMIFDNTFNNNKNEYELLNMFKKIVNNDNKRINFEINEIE